MELTVIDSDLFNKYSVIAIAVIARPLVDSRAIVWCNWTSISTRGSWIVLTAPSNAEVNCYEEQLHARGSGLSSVHWGNELVALDGRKLTPTTRSSSMFKQIGHPAYMERGLDRGSGYLYRVGAFTIPFHRNHVNTSGLAPVGP